VKEFERNWAQFCGTKYAVGLSNGTDALVLALEALHVGPGDEVIVQGNAYIADALVVDYVGARMVLVDQVSSVTVAFE
jgi:dTDP-4-amino-4,6-dideoxygalactose transaminase